MCVSQLTSVGSALLKMVSYFAKKKKEQAMIADKSSFRKDKQKHRKAMKSTAEKVSRFSFLTPALVLVPATDGVSALHNFVYRLLLLHGYYFIEV